MMTTLTKVHASARALLLALTLMLPAGALAQLPESPSPEPAAPSAPLPRNPDLESLYISHRLEDAVAGAVLPLKARLLGLLARPDESSRLKTHHRRRQERPNPWRLVMPSPFDFLDDATGSRPVYLIDVVQEAIRAHMQTLGEIAWEYERQGIFSYKDRIRHADPGFDGAGDIRVDPMGALHDITINFRARIEHPAGATPAVLVRFRFQADPEPVPLLCRLIIPSAGISPSFSRELGPARGGAATLRDYGMVPQLVPIRTILEVQGDNGWERPANDWQEHFRPPSPTPVRGPDPWWVERDLGAGQGPPIEP